MYFYVFLQPEVFSEASTDGEDAMQYVASILSGLLQNCFLSVFEDDRWAPSVKEILEAWPETSTRKRIMSILVHLKKHKRFLYCITPDYMDDNSDIDCVFDQASTIPLDLMIVIEAEKGHAAPVGTEIASRRSYQSTAFEPMRSDIAVHGKTCIDGEMDNISFMNFHFARALKYATEIHICDRICGSKNLADNFIYTIKQLTSWLGNLVHDPASCKIVFHLGQPAGQYGIDHILDQLSICKRNYLPQTEMLMQIYNDASGTQSLPHQRFIMTDQISLNIERGLDFLDRNTRHCRDTYISCQNLEEAQRLLNSYASSCISIHRVS